MPLLILRNNDWEIVPTKRELSQRREMSTSTYKRFHLRLTTPKKRKNKRIFFVQLRKKLREWKKKSC